MIDSDDFVKALQDIGFDFFTGVPDTILGGIIEVLGERQLYTPAVREDEAVAMAAGAFLGGKNSGRADAKFRTRERTQRAHFSPLDLPNALSASLSLGEDSKAKMPLNT